LYHNATVLLPYVCLFVEIAVLSDGTGKRESSWLGAVGVELTLLTRRDGCEDFDDAGNRTAVFVGTCGWEDVAR